MDFYRKVPSDLLQTTASGGILTITAAALMVLVLMTEVSVFLSTEVKTSIDIDTYAGSQLRINFNLSFPHLHCDYASVDLWDKIGRNAANVTQNIEKWQLDADGTKRMYQGRNRRAFDIEHDDHKHAPLEELHLNGKHVFDVDADAWEGHHETHEYVFVNFYAPWCPYCQRLEKTWEALAEDLERRDLGVSVAAMDCVANEKLCHDLHVQTFPTLRFYHHGQQVNEGEYRFDRTVQALGDFAQRKIDSENIYRQYPEARAAHAANWNSDHPGCLVSGFLLVNRVPGNFHVMAHSKHHSLNTLRTNLSHYVHHMSFGVPLSDNQHAKLADVGEVHARTHTLDKTFYSTPRFHAAEHHHIHVVPTKYHLGLFWQDKFSAFQTMHSHHLLDYDANRPPEARFSYDLSPMAVKVERVRRAWYDFVTNLLAIIGGGFALARLANDSAQRLF